MNYSIIETDLPSYHWKYPNITVFRLYDNKHRRFVPSFYLSLDAAEWVLERHRNR